MTTTEKAMQEVSTKHPEVEILKRFSAPNWDRINGLIKLDGYTEREATQYDHAERRLAALSELASFRGSDDLELQEACDLELILDSIQTRVTARNSKLYSEVMI